MESNSPTLATLSSLATFTHLRLFSFPGSVRFCFLRFPPPRSFLGSGGLGFAFIQQALILYSCLKSSRRRGWLTSRRSWDARYVRQSGDDPLPEPFHSCAPATPYIGASLTPLLSHRSVPSYSTSPSHSLTVYTRFAVPA